MTGLFFTDVAAAASGNAAIGVRPGNDGLAGVGILDIEQVPGSRVFTVILTNGRRIPVQISEGLPGVSPILIGGTVTAVTAGAPLSAKVNKVSEGVYSIDLLVPAGPVPFLPPVAWAAGLDFTAVLPASAVVYGRSSYVCIVSHTSAVPFDPTKWVLIASGGIDGTGTLNGPSAATSGVVAVFDGPSGGKIKEGPAIGTAAGNLVRLDPTTGKLPAVDGSALTNLSIPAQKRYDNVVFLTSSQTWTAPAKIRGRATVIGGFGSGGNAHATAANAAAASGGAAPGLSFKSFTANANDQAVVTVGAGGASSSILPGTAQAINGTSGGASTFVGFGATITANGGGGGLATIAANGTTAATAAGAAGGTATGGDLNYTGGGSGIASAAAGEMAAATGGGALAWFGTAYSSGSATNTTSGLPAASGGAGIGAASANATNNVTAGGKALGLSQLIPTATPSSLAGITAFGLFNFNGNGGLSGVSNGTPGNQGDPGGGGGGSYGYNSPSQGGQPSLFGGGGGAANDRYNAVSTVGNSFSALNFGATGGAATTFSAVNNAGNNVVGAAAPGLVIIEYDVVS